MIYFIKGFLKIQENNVYSDSPIQSLGEVMQNLY